MNRTWFCAVWDSVGDRVSGIFFDFRSGLSAQQLGESLFSRVQSFLISRITESFDYWEGYGTVVCWTPSSWF
jgi:hypothetical protein